MPMQAEMAPPVVAKKAAVLGGGSFGTALAELLARQGTDVKLQMRDTTVIEEVNARHMNSKYMKGLNLNANITALSCVKESVKDADLVLLAVPTAYFREFLHNCRDLLPVGIPLVVCSKGIENDTLLTPFEIMEYELPGKYHPFVVVMSGPSFAREVIEKKPTSVSISARDMAMAKLAQYYISDKYFRAYRSDDVMGCEICGAIKNVYAIAAGTIDGLNMGSDGRAALITRALAEISRLAVMKGAHPLTISGLAGVGDLVLTCTGTLSRNYQFGNRIAKGETIEEIRGSMKMVAEGVNTSKSLYQMLEKMDVKMPIAEEVYKVLYEGRSPKEAMMALAAEPLQEELDEMVKAGVHSGTRYHNRAPPSPTQPDDKSTNSYKLVEHLP